MAAARMRLMSSRDMVRRLDRAASAAWWGAWGAASSAEPDRDDRRGRIGCLPSPNKRCLHAAVGVRGLRLTWRRPTGCAGPRGPVRTTRLSCLPVWWTSRWWWCAAPPTGPATACWKHCGRSGVSACRSNGTEQQLRDAACGVLHRARLSAPGLGIAGRRRAGLGRADAARLRQPAHGVRAVRWPTTTSILRCDWSRRRPSCSACGSAMRWRGWAERVVAVADPTIRCSPQQSARPHGVPGIVVTSIGRVRLAALAGGRVPGRGARASPIPRTCSPTRPCSRVTCRAPWSTGRARRRGPAVTSIRSGWCRRSPRSRSGTLCWGFRMLLARSAGGGCRRRRHGQPDGAVDGLLCAGLLAQEVRTRAGAGAVRRGGATGRGGAEFLVVRHRVDGGCGRPARCTAIRLPRRRCLSRCSTTGSGSVTGPSSGSLCATSPGCWSLWALTTMRCCCTARCEGR